MIGQRLPVSIVVPAFGAAAQLAECLESLCQHLPPGCDVLVADDATPDGSICDIVKSFESRLSLTYVRRPENLGFVENCNQAIWPIVPGGNDVLLLNSDTRVTAGFLEEMWEVLHLHEKHGTVTPRSNNAAIFSVPVTARLASEDAYQLWTSIRHLLPRYHTMPTAVGFCLLIKNVVLRQFGAFDPAYSPAYNEENDFICRINRHGYSAVVAHQAFVFHDESASFGSRRKALEHRNRQLLDSRYPEYSRKVGQYMRYGMDPVDHFAMLWPPHRQTILFDLFHLRAEHSEASDFALSLLLRLAPLLESRYDLRVWLAQEAREFFSHELTGYRFFDPEREESVRFDLVFKPGQIFTWSELYWMIRLGGRIAYTHVEMSAVRCDYLSNPNTRTLFQTAAQLSDRVITISESSKEDFAAFYDLPLPFEVIRLGTHEDPGALDRSASQVLVVGNRLDHMAVHRAAAELQGMAHVVVVDGGKDPIPGSRWLASDGLSRAAMTELYDQAAVVVYPSFYEGFGIPLVDAIARGIPVVALDTAENREIGALTDPDRLFLVKEYGELRSVVSSIISNPPAGARNGNGPGKWADVARQYACSFHELLERELDVELIQRRWELLKTIDSVHPLA